MTRKQCEYCDVISHRVQPFCGRRTRGLKFYSDFRKLRKTIFNLHESVWILIKRNSIFTDSKQPQLLDVNAYDGALDALVSVEDGMKELLSHLETWLSWFEPGTDNHIIGLLMKGAALRTKAVLVEDEETRAKICFETIKILEPLANSYKGNFLS